MKEEAALTAADKAGKPVTYPVKDMTMKDAEWVKQEIEKGQVASELYKKVVIELCCDPDSNLYKAAEL